MPTPWTLPTVITQYAEDTVHIPWDNLEHLSYPDQGFAKTQKPLLHIAVSRDRNIRQKTWFLVCQGFNFTSLPTTIPGIELNVQMNRGGRITDDTIQLYRGQELIGDNLADLTLAQNSYYGGETDLWGSNLAVADITETFGIILRYKSHPSFPHRETAMIDSVRLRIW